MVMRVQKIGDGLGILLSAEAIAALGLADGTGVQVEALPDAGSEPQIQYLSDAEAIASYRTTLPQFREAYEELAK